MEMVDMGEIGSSESSLEEDEAEDEDQSEDEDSESDSESERDELEYLDEPDEQYVDEEAFGYPEM